MPENNKKNYLQISMVLLLLSLITQTAIVSGYIFTTREKAVRNELDIREMRGDMKKFVEKVYDKLEKIHKDIPSHSHN